MADETLNPFVAPRADLEGQAEVVGEIRLAERGTRLVAALLDTLVLLPGLVLLVALVILRPTGSAAVVGPWGFLLWTLAVVITQAVLLTRRGQTLGKRWMKIRVVRLDGSNPGFAWAVLVRSLVNTIAAGVPYLGWLYWLVDVLFIFRDDRRCIHDLMAGTQVVMAS
jgi:uncharacterized RDD family membrane protein YckC